MSDLVGAVAVAQLGRIDDYIARRRASAEVMESILLDVPGITPQKLRAGDRSGYYCHGFLYEKDEIGVDLESFVEAVKAEGATPVNGAYLGGRPLYRFPIFAEARTYGNSGYPFVDEQGNRRIDYNALHLPVLEEELPKTLSVGGNSSYMEEDASDIANAIRKVALHYAAGH